MLRDAGFDDVVTEDCTNQVFETTLWFCCEVWFYKVYLKKLIIETQ